MREREDIELDKRTEVYGYAEIHQVILEVLLDIRELLASNSENKNEVKE